MCKNILLNLTGIWQSHMRQKFVIIASYYYSLTMKITAYNSLSLKLILSGSPNYWCHFCTVHCYTIIKVKSMTTNHVHHILYAYQHLEADLPDQQHRVFRKTYYIYQHNRGSQRHILISLSFNSYFTFTTIPLFVIIPSY